MSQTSITHEHRSAFEALTSGEFSNFALFNCFADGAPAAAICAVNRDGEGFSIRPLFVPVTDSMRLTGHDGRSGGKQLNLTEASGFIVFWTGGIRSFIYRPDQIRRRRPIRCPRPRHRPCPAADRRGTVREGKAGMSNNLKIVEHPLVQYKLSQMRRKETPSSDFRRLLREISLLLAYEVMRDLPLVDKEIETPMARAMLPVLRELEPCFISILRAGNGILEGMLDLLPSARAGHVGMYRDHETLEAIEYYFKVPEDMAGRLTIVCDPMLATGHTAVAAIQRLKDAGAKKIKFVCLLAAPEGVKTLTEAHPDVPIFTAALDEKLNEKGYIVPGLGDAGDRIYGTK
jgi:uracil phosphoribosyltransferase